MTNSKTAADKGSEAYEGSLQEKLVSQFNELCCLYQEARVSGLNPTFELTDSRLKMACHGVNLTLFLNPGAA